ncbi:MAG: hypothetical protein JWP44_4687 [Mucilaginibacter sp.]|nr:hypothetical protein [Mucilaginibacter sp.]
MIISGCSLRVSGRLLRMARVDAEKFLFLESDPDEAIAALRESHKRVDLFTFQQRLPETTPKYSYPMEWDNFAAIPLTTFDHWWNQQLGFKARNKAKQAGKKGVVIRAVAFDRALTASICEIYNECPVRQGRPFRHYGKDHETVHREAATYLDRSVFFGAFSQDKLIGFIKLVVDDSGTQAGLMNIVALIRQRDKAPANALVAEAVRECTARGIRFLTYANFAYGKKQSDSLSDFKERNGFVRMNVPRYYVPLTPLGATALRLRLHRRLSERVPESVAVRVRELRESWYRWRFASTAEVS